MDDRRFDVLTKVFGRGLTRRRAIGRLAGGGLAATALAAAGSRAPSAAAAQEGTDQTCILPFEATVRQGPSAGQDFSGTLAIKIGASGEIETGVLVHDGTGIPVVGQITGRAVNLLLTTGDGQYVFGVGTSEADLRLACPEIMAAGIYAESGAMGGPFVGPQPLDAGDWLICCCPSEANNFTCTRPQCPVCEDPGSVGGGYVDPGCVSGCTNVGESADYCSDFCTLLG
jgi:hypothetical protein